MSALTASAPKEIYLCVSDDLDHYAEPFPGEHDEVTWGDHAPVACTVKYVRKDIVDVLQADLAAARADAERLRTSRRDRFAAAALAGIAAHHAGPSVYGDETRAGAHARWALAVADEIMQRLG